MNTKEYESMMKLHELLDLLAAAREYINITIGGDPEEEEYTGSLADRIDQVLLFDKKKFLPAIASFTRIWNLQATLKSQAKGIRRLLRKIKRLQEENADLDSLNAKLEARLEIFNQKYGNPKYDA